MHCPACGSQLVERTSQKGVLFLVCSKYPECAVSGTPALMERFDDLRRDLELPPARKSDPVPLGGFISELARLRVLQSKLNRAGSDEERERIRAQAAEVMR